MGNIDSIQSIKSEINACFCDLMNNVIHISFNKDMDIDYTYAEKMRVKCIESITAANNRFNSGKDISTIHDIDIPNIIVQLRSLPLSDHGTVDMQNCRNDCVQLVEDLSELIIEYIQQVESELNKIKEPEESKTGTKVSPDEGSWVQL